MFNVKTSLILHYADFRNLPKKNPRESLLKHHLRVGREPKVVMKMAVQRRQSRRRKRTQMHPRGQWVVSCTSLRRKGRLVFTEFDYQFIYLFIIFDTELFTISIYTHIFVYLFVCMCIYLQSLEYLAMEAFLWCTLMLVTLPISASDQASYYQPQWLI